MSRKSGNRFSEEITFNQNAKVGSRLGEKSVSLSVAVLTAVLAASVAGCSGFGSKPQQPAVDPNIFPQNYRKQIAVFLAQQLLDRADFHGARISQAVLKPVGGADPRYVVCLQFNGHSEIKNKMAIYLSGQITQFVDATPELCGDAVYQPFTELEQVLPDK